jgi:hypothetical protein
MMVKHPERIVNPLFRFEVFQTDVHYAEKQLKVLYDK